MCSNSSIPCTASCTLHSFDATCWRSLCVGVQGGLGGEPGNEAHGGYTYCGVAALALLGKVDALDVVRLEAWLAQRQAPVEGGFNGRTNKLTDGCYSFWQGGACAVLARSHRDERSMQRRAGGCQANATPEEERQAGAADGLRPLEAEAMHDVGQSDPVHSCGGHAPPARHSSSCDTGV